MCRKSVKIRVRELSQSSFCATNDEFGLIYDHRQSSWDVWPLLNGFPSLKCVLNQQNINSCQSLVRLQNFPQGHSFRSSYSATIQFREWNEINFKLSAPNPNSYNLFCFFFFDSTEFPFRFLFFLHFSFEMHLNIEWTERREINKWNGRKREIFYFILVWNRIVKRQNENRKYKMENRERDDV